MPEERAETEAGHATGSDESAGPQAADSWPQEEASGPRSRLWRAGRTGWAILGIIGVLVVAGFLAAELALIVVPVVLALFPATLLVPVAAKLKDIGVPDALAAILSILLAFVVIGGIIGAMVPLVLSDVPDLVESASEGIQEIEQFLEDDPLGLGLGGPAELLQAAREQFGEIGQYAGQAGAAAVTAFETFAGLLLLFVVLFFYLKDGRRLADGVISVAPETSRPRLRRAADRSWETLGSYFRGQLLVALVDAIFIGIGLLILGVPLAVPLAVLIFFGGLFPIVGAVTTGALAVLVALADAGLTTALIVLGLVLLVQQLESNVLEPLILGKAIDLHPIVVLLAITTGAVTLGILGAFLAVPVAAIIGRVVADDEDEGEVEEDGRATDQDAGELRAATEDDEEPGTAHEWTEATSDARTVTGTGRREGGSHSHTD
jgi:putative heme transporter